MGNIIKYGDYDLETAQQEKEDLESGGADFLKLKVGRNLVRILPPPVGKRSPFQVVYQHFIDLPGKSVHFACPRLMAKRPCPACEQADKLKSSGSQADADAAANFFARRRVFCNAIDRGDEDKGPQVLAFGKTVHEQLVALRADEDAGGDFTHPVEGYDIIIERSGTKKNDTKYTVRPARKASQLHGEAAQMQEWIDTQKDLVSFANVLTAEQLRAKLERTDGEEPARGDGKASGGGKRRAEDDAIDTEGEATD